MDLHNEQNISVFLERVNQNLLVLQRNLIELGYRFANPEATIVLAAQGDRVRIKQLEDNHGELPLFYRAWYEKFRSIDFSQEMSQLISEFPSEVAGLGYNLPLVWYDIDRCLLLRHSLQERGVRVEGILGNGEIRYLIPTGGIASNCEPKGVWIPDSSTDPILYDEGAGPITMAEEIRNAFRHGGFPFWARIATKKARFLPIKYGPSFSVLINALSKNLVPL